MLAPLFKGIPQTGAEIRDAVGWQNSIDNFQHLMRQLDRKGFIVTARRGAPLTCRGRTVCQFRNWHQITEPGLKALRDYWGFSKRTEAIARKTARPTRSTTGEPLFKIVKKPEVPAKPRRMNGKEWQQFLTSDAPEEFKVFLRATQHASLGDTALLCDEAASIDYQDEDWAHLGDYHKLSDPIKGERSKLQMMCARVFLLAAAMGEDALTFPSPKGEIPGVTRRKALCSIRTSNTRLGRR